MRFWCPRTLALRLWRTMALGQQNQSREPNRHPKMSPLDQASPRARITGTVYLLYFVAAISAQILITRRFTASGAVMNLFADGLYIALTFLLYHMFRPVSRTISLIAALFSLAGCGVMMMTQLHPNSSPVNPLIFFGPFCVFLGYLILRSIFLPRLFGILLILAGLAWVIYPLPGLPHAVLLSIQGLGIMAEALLMLWLVTRGVPEEQWRAQRERPHAQVVKREGR